MHYNIDNEIAEKENIENEITDKEIFVKDIYNIILSPCKHNIYDNKCYHNTYIILKSDKKRKIFIGSLEIKDIIKLYKLKYYSYTKMPRHIRNKYSIINWLFTRPNELICWNNYKIKR
jgi:hypothetical protein